MNVSGVNVCDEDGSLSPHRDDPGEQRDHEGANLEKSRHQRQ